MRIAVNWEDSFTCPFCGQEYEIEEHEGGVAVVYADHYCSHLDTEIFPTHAGWEVYFKGENDS